MSTRFYVGQLAALATMMHTKFVKAHSGAQLPIPDYNRECITMLPAFFQDVLTGKTTSPLTQIANDAIELSDIKNVVFFLVDGFGTKQWEDHRETTKALKRFENDGYVGKIDSVFPSCTPNALATLHANGLSPAQHGLVDWWIYIKEIDKIIATLPFAEMGSEEKDSVLKLGLGASTLMNCRTTYEKFEDKGIKTRVFTLEKYVTRAHSEVSFKGSKIVPYNDVSSLFAALLDTLQRPQATPTYAYVYWGKIDAAGHEYGVNSSEYKQAVGTYFDELDTFLSSARTIDKTLFVISADHGQINVNSDKTIYLDTIEGLSDHFKISANGSQILPWGGAREVFLAIKEGHEEHAITLLHTAIGNDIEIIKSRDALHAGLFGATSNMHPDFPSRIGDIIILPKGSNTVWYHHPGEDPLERKGDHGGLTDGEIKVPFGLLRSY